MLPEKKGRIAIDWEIVSATLPTILHRPYHLPIPSLFCYGYSITDMFTQDQNTRSIYWNCPVLPKRAGQSYIGVAF